MVQPNKWGEVLGYNADYNQLPEDATLTASFSKLFPEITQIPLEVGGTPPKRRDLNAIFKLIGENVFYYQNGGVFEYNDNIIAIYKQEDNYVKPVRVFNTEI